MLLNILTVYYFIYKVIIIPNKNFACYIFIKCVKDDMYIMNTKYCMQLTIPNWKGGYNICARSLL